MAETLLRDAIQTCDLLSNQINHTTVYNHLTEFQVIRQTMKYNIIITYT